MGERKLADAERKPGQIITQPLYNVVQIFTNQLFLDNDHRDMLGITISRIMDGEVTVSYNGRDLRIDIEDVNPDDLRDLFGIDFDVKTLLEVETEKTILIKKKDKLKPGFTYVLQKPIQESNTSKSPQVVGSKSIKYSNDLI